MKYLLLLVVVFVVVWWLRSGARRRAQADVPPAPTRAGPGAQPMITCTHCGVHLPQREAVSGAEGAYCSEAHRLAHGDGGGRGGHSGSGGGAR